MEQTIQKVNKSSVESEDKEIPEVSHKHRKKRGRPKIVHESFSKTWGIAKGSEVMAKRLEDNKEFKYRIISRAGRATPGTKFEATFNMENIENGNKGWVNLKEYKILKVCNKVCN